MERVVVDFFMSFPLKKNVSLSHYPPWLKIVSITVGPSNGRDLYSCLRKPPPKNMFSDNRQQAA